MLCFPGPVLGNLSVADPSRIALFAASSTSTSGFSSSTTCKREQCNQYQEPSWLILLQCNERARKHVVPSWSICVKGSWLSIAWLSTSTNGNLAGSVLKSKDIVKEQYRLCGAVGIVCAQGLNGCVTAIGQVRSNVSTLSSNS